MTKNKALAKITQVNCNSFPDQNPKEKLDLMYPAMCSQEAHCNTCQCMNYITYTGYTFKYKDKEEYNLVRDMTQDKRIQYVREHADQVVTDA